MIQDLRWALRWLHRRPLFAIAVIGILALGIGANTAVFSIVDAVLLRPLAYNSPATLVRVRAASPKRPALGISASDFLSSYNRPDLFAKTAPYLRDMVTLTGAGEPDQVWALRASAGLFSLLGSRAELGRPLLDSDDQFHSPLVALLSDRLWRRRFQADPDVVGRSITASGQVFTIVGVMPRQFDFPSSDIEMWIPLRLTPATLVNLELVARLRPGVSLARVQSAMRIVAQQLEQQDPNREAGLAIEVTPWRDEIGHQYELTLVFILAAVGLVLLIACADVGGLLLSRAVEREREMAIRASLGAGFWRVGRQLLAESCVLAILASVAGIAGARYTLDFLTKRLAALPVVLPHLQRVSLDARVLLFNIGLCLLLACLCSLAPIVFTSRNDLQAVLRAGHGSASKASTRLFSLLIASEAAFAFLLLVGSGLMVRSLIRLEQADHGFHPDHVLTMRVPIGTRTQTRPSGRYDTKPRQMAYYHDLLERLRTVPGVRAVAVTNNLPLSGANTQTFLRGPDGNPVLIPTRTISAQYFAAMGIPLMAGRIFTDADQAGAPAVAIINESLARQLYPHLDPLGQILPVPDASKPVTIVGVVRDASQVNYDQPARGEVYLPYQQTIFGTFLSTIVVRTSGNPLALAAALRNQVWAVDPNQPVLKVETMDDVIADSIWRPRFSAWLFSVLGGLALLLTCAGVYSVVAYTVSLRQREVGIRVALGASPAKVVALVLRDSLMPLLGGLAVSLVAALLLSRLLQGLLYEIAGTDPVTYVAAGAILLAVGAFSSARPAWRAAVADPLRALRTE